MNTLAGIGKTDRKRLAAILRAAKATVPMDDAAAVKDRVHFIKAKAAVEDKIFNPSKPPPVSLLYQM